MSGSSSGAVHPTLVLIDGHSLAFRSYFGVKRQLSNSKGQSTQAVVGFMRVLLRFLRLPHTQVIVTFDPPCPTFRHEQYPAYKAGRAEMPADLPAQIDAIRALVDALGVPRLEVAGCEADDVIGSLTHQANALGMTVHIVSSDRDTYQLLGLGNVYVVKSDNTLLGPQDVLDEYGVTVEQWLDFRALTGDSSDNIPGAKGIGKVTAAKILQEYGNLQHAFAAAYAGTLKPDGVRKKLLESEENVHLSRHLSQMLCELELEVALGEPRGAGNPQQLEELLDELELSSIRAEIAKLAYAQKQAGNQSNQSSAQTSTQAASLSPLIEPPLAEWQAPSSTDVVWGYQLSREDDLSAALIAAAYLDPLEQTCRVAPTTEPSIWAELEQGQPRLLSSEQPDSAPLSKAQQKQQLRAEQQAQKALAQAKAQHPATVELEVFAHTPEVNAAAAKALAAHLLAQGQQAEPADDPLLMAYLLDPSNSSMAQVCPRYLGCEWPTQPEEVSKRAAISMQLLSVLPPLFSPEQQRLYQEMEKPLAGVLARMEVRGVALDADYLRGLSLALGQQLQTLEGRIYEQAGREFAIRSRDQLEAVLYDELGLANSKKTKLTKKRSTAVSALEPLLGEHPIIASLLEFRELEKLRSTYLQPLPDLINPHTGRLHTTFQQTTVATGRLSSVNPNLQNIPMRSELGRQIRKGFVASAGFSLISADYSQIELRLLAHISGDTLMQQAFAQGADIHRRTAAQVLGLAEVQVTPEQRRAAKTVNFGVLYGMSAHRLSQELGIAYQEASSFIQTYFDTYPNIQRYIDQTLDFGRSEGYVQTLYGRRRYVPELLASNRIQREAGERLAYNMPIQGTAADIIKLAMIQLEKALKPLGAHLLLQVHDELLIEAPSAQAQEAAELTQQVMQNAAQLSVPLAVEYGIGENWYNAK